MTAHGSENLCSPAASAAKGDVMMSHVVKEKYVGKVEMRLPVLGVIVLHHIRPTYTARAALQHAEVARAESQVNNPVSPRRATSLLDDV